MKLSQKVSVLLMATIALALAACGSQPDLSPSEQVINKDTNQAVAVKAGVQPAWSNEGDQSEAMLVTLRSSRA